MGNHEYCEDCGASSFHHGEPCDPKRLAANKAKRSLSTFSGIPIGFCVSTAERIGPDDLFWNPVANDWEKAADNPHVKYGWVKHYPVIVTPTEFTDKTFDMIQNEIGVWALSNFKDNKSKWTGQILGSLAPFLGMVEELGELAHPIIYRHQGRGFIDDKEYRKAVEDALADLLVFMCDFSNREGFLLMDCLRKVWTKVQKRRQEKWLEDKAKEELGGDQGTVGQAKPIQHVAQYGALDSKDWPERDPRESRSVGPNFRKSVIKALDNGWELNSDTCVHLPGDESNGWAAEWLRVLIPLNGPVAGLKHLIVRAPHWLERRIKELEAEKAALDRVAAAAKPDSEVHAGFSQPPEETARETGSPLSNPFPFAMNTAEGIQIVDRVEEGRSVGRLNCFWCGREFDEAHPPRSTKAGKGVCRDGCLMPPG